MKQLHELLRYGGEILSKEKNPDKHYNNEMTAKIKISNTKLETIISLNSGVGYIDCPTVEILGFAILENIAVKYLDEY